MAWTQKLMVAGLLGLAALVVGGRLKGSQQQTGESAGPSASSPIKGAAFAGTIPVYPGAKLTDIMGGDHMNEVGGPVLFTSQSWFFKVADSRVTVVEFYRKNLPPGTQPAEAEPGATAFKWIPAGAAEGESVTVTVRDGELQIGETVKVKQKP